MSVAEDVCRAVMGDIIERNLYGHVRLTGHSLGGAMALLVGAFFVRNNLTVDEIVTFGAPRVGRLKVLEGTRIACFRHGRDMTGVPWMMPRPRKLTNIGDKGGPISDHRMDKYLEAL